MIPGITTNTTSQRAIGAKSAHATQPGRERSVVGVAVAAGTCMGQSKTPEAVTLSVAKDPR
jgi:hypothetical protein